MEAVVFVGHQNACYSTPAVRRRLEPEMRHVRLVVGGYRARVAAVESAPSPDASESPPLKTAPRTISTPRRPAPDTHPAQAPPARVAIHPTPPHTDQISPAPSEPPTPSLTRGRMFWLWWKTLSGSYVVFTSTNRS